MFRKITLFLSGLGLVGALVATMAGIFSPPSVSAAAIEQAGAEVGAAPAR